jgi:predicted TIM-barrel fold metal-dependent hydrolase
VARPGSLYDWYRGNPRGQRIVEAFGELEPLRSEYQDRAQRLAVLDEQGLAGELTAHVRVDRLLLGSDWPHAEGTRTPADFVTESLADLPPDQVQLIRRDNALSLLGLTLP